MVSSAVYANALKSFRVWPSPDETRVVMDLSSEAHFTYFTLSNPARLVVDLKDTTIRTKLPVFVRKSPVLKKIRRSSAPEKGTYRLVFELKKKISPELFTLAPTPKGEYGHRLVVDLPHGSTVHKQKASSANTSKNHLIPPKTIARDVSQFYGTKDIVVAIDAGHGGEDPGSIGPGGHYEKNVTISIAKKVKALIDAIPGMKAVLTRRGDYFVNLNRRSEIARKNKAHLLISIHADAFRTPQPRGASVFVLNTRRANTEIAKWVEDHERQSELLGGAGQVLAKNSNDKNVSQTLLDLQFSHSQKEGYTLATDIIHQLRRVVHMHRSKPVNASLAVLKSPDIPSVLVETGFISNPTEEKLLFQRTHQDKIAQALSKAIVEYFNDNPPEGTLFASRKKAKKHKVHSGEFLSLIAKKYGVSVKQLMVANHLKSTSLRVGQILVIPGNNAAVSLSAVKSQNPVETRTITHKVARGEYLGRIADKYKVSVAAIKRENHLSSNTLRVGQRLKITVTLKDKPVRKHKVHRGEYLGKIASYYRVSIDNLRRVNQLKSDSLRVGQILIIPNR
ncbi:N-acetylmuramoyl-L-alanine amidase [Vibrio salinus]|uniref:N-acetylmuramoyl-L-alanine amidase n=1 Tax=Vibrio salinus TaxID=2899784 RepID=UPI001E651C50|nr:N-acetylmuramoyl-L-alanine amidase [Vibrio salinus]MCE0493491.1 N-acetylmuramoyl-L-alanine amidase [Vibrio salinus]